MAANRELLEGLNRAITGDEASLAHVATEDLDFRDSLQAPHGLDDVRAYLRTWAQAFPDATVDIVKIIDTGDEAVAEVTYRGTHTGPLASPQGEIPGTGRRVELPGVMWITVREGRIATFRGFYDTASMMAQLGLMPEPAATR